jgi:serine/threonine protein phosphatase 1
MRWIIGDVHGHLTALAALVDHIQRCDSKAALLFLGDYVNRGPQTRGVIDLLLSLNNARFLRGNHDDMLDLMISGSSYADNDASDNPALAVRWFMEYGLDDTLASYGMPPAEAKRLDRDPKNALKRIAATIPPSHRDFLHGLSPVIEEEDFFLAHAYWPPADNKPLTPLAVRLHGSATNRRHVVWSRFSAQEVMHDKTWPRTGYFGHTPTPFYESLLPQPYHPIRGPRIVLLDTAIGTDARGRLTAYCHEEQRFVQADREGKIIENR